MPSLLGIHGSVTQPGRLHQALELALDSVDQQRTSITTSLLHLGEHQISFADGRRLSAFTDDTNEVVRQVLAADMYLIATPIFRASFTASLKNLLDLVPMEGLMGKVCGLVAMGPPTTTIWPSTPSCVLCWPGLVLTWFQAKSTSNPVISKMGNWPTLMP